MAKNKQVASKIKPQPTAGNYWTAIGLTLPLSETTFRPMGGSTQDIRDYAAGAVVRRSATNVFSRANRSFKALLIAFLVFAGTPVAASHAQSHVTAGGQQQIALIDLNDTQDDSDTGSVPSSGLEHHACSCPCLEPLPTRSHYISAFLDGSRIRYSAYLDTLGSSAEPDPIRKPPRLGVSA